MHAPNQPASVSEILAPWRTRLDAAHEAQQVVEIVRDYVSGWPPQKLAKVPRLPAQVNRPDEISSIALTLVQRLYAEVEPAAELHEMAEFFAAASRRLAEVLDWAVRGRSASERRTLF